MTGPEQRRDEPPSPQGQQASAPGGTRGRVLIHVVGVLSLLVAGGFAFGAWFLLTFGTSHCRDAAPSSDVLTLKIGILVIGGILAAVPYATGRQAHAAGTGSAAWFALSGVIASVSLLYAIVAVPGQFCFSF